jgi:hypothetical protein
VTGLIKHKTVEQAPIPAVLSASEREHLRHPLEKRIVNVVAVLDAMLVLLVLSLLVLGAEWLDARPAVAKYKTHARILLVLVLGAPALVTYATRRHRILAQEESIRVGATQLPEIHGVLVEYCRRAGIPVPDLFVSDGVDHTTAFAWRGHQCVILSTHDFTSFPGAFDEVVEFALAHAVGSICLGHTSYRQELLRSFVAPIPFLRGPLHQIRTYSRDRYAAVLAPRAIRALIVAASGDRLLNRVDLDAYFAQLDEASERGFLKAVVWLLRRRVPLAHRVRQLRRAGLLR